MGRIISLSFRRPGPAQIKNITINQTWFRHQRLPATHGTFTVARLISLHTDCTASTTHALCHHLAGVTSAKELNCLQSKKGGIRRGSSSTTEQSYRGKKELNKGCQHVPKQAEHGEHQRYLRLQQTSEEVTLHRQIS